MALIYTMVTRLTGPRGQMIPLCVCGGGVLFFSRAHLLGGFKAQLLEGIFSFLKAQLLEGVFSFSRLSSPGEGIFFFKTQILDGVLFFLGSAPGEVIFFFKAQLLEGIFSFSRFSYWRGCFLFKAQLLESFFLFFQDSAPGGGYSLFSRFSYWKGFFFIFSGHSSWMGYYPFQGSATGRVFFFFFFRIWLLEWVFSFSWLIPV